MMTPIRQKLFKVEMEMMHVRPYNNPWEDKQTLPKLNITHKRSRNYPKRINHKEKQIKEMRKYKMRYDLVSMYKIVLRDGKELYLTVEYKSEYRSCRKVYKPSYVKYCLYDLYKFTQTEVPILRQVGTVRRFEFEKMTNLTDYVVYSQKIEDEKYLAFRKNRKLASDAIRSYNKIMQLIDKGEMQHV